MLHSMGCAVTTGIPRRLPIPHCEASLAAWFNLIMVVVKLVAADVQEAAGVKGEE